MSSSCIWAVHKSKNVDTNRIKCMNPFDPVCKMATAQRTAAWARQRLMFFCRALLSSGTLICSRATSVNLLPHNDVIAVACPGGSADIEVCKIIVHRSSVCFRPTSTVLVQDFAPAHGSERGGMRSRGSHCHSKQESRKSIRKYSFLLRRTAATRIMHAHMCTYVKRCALCMWYPV